MGCIHEEEVVIIIYGKEMRACTHKRDNHGIGVIILEENFVEMGLIIVEILLFVKCDLVLHFQDQLMLLFCRKPKLHYFGEGLVKNGHRVAEIQLFL